MFRHYPIQQAPNQQLLFSLLQFVALVIPAVAVLMRIVKERDGVGSGSFKILEIGIVLMICSGLLIGWQLINTMENTLTSVGMLLVVSSLGLVVAGMSWKFIPTELRGEITESPVSVGYKLTRFLVVVIVNALFFFGVYHYTSNLVGEHLSVGPIVPLTIIDFVGVYPIILAIIYVKSLFMIIEGGYLGRERFHQTVIQGFTAVFVLYLLFMLFVIPVFGILIGITALPKPLPQFNTSSWIFVVGYSWGILIMVIVSGVSFDTDSGDSDADMEIKKMRSG